ncbi:BGTF surface domain-containing protein [Halorussus halophilus]|uniref:BGTF surface domain-containing protein n=1 Tax=Halorussus halophilus TaxID=2650975 RepID=UPI001301812F|nr:BGTF surface domain-containing protein [Halorussus halophilus]
MTQTRTSVLLTALVVFGALTGGLAAASATETTQEQHAELQQTDSLADAGIDSGSVFWQGQFLRLSANQSDAGSVWSVRRVENGEAGQLVTEVLLDGTGSAVVSTSRLDGEFVVVNENNEPVVLDNGTAAGAGSVEEASWEVAVQELNATFADTVVRNDDVPDARTDLRLESNRAGYRFEISSDQLNTEEVASIFPAVEVRDDQAVVTRNVSSDATFDANFTGVEAGTYDFMIRTLDNVVTDTASIQVTPAVEGSAALGNATVTDERGDVATFNVTFNETDRATVSLGSRDVGYLARFTVVDQNDDGVATVRINTYRAGLANQSGISAVGEDQVQNYSLQTDPVPGRLDAATYPIRTFVGSTQTGVGTLVLNERSTEGIQVWTAPDRESVRNVQTLSEVASQTDNVAFQDWAIVQVQASGLSGYVQNVSDLNNDQTGLSMTLTRVGEINQPSVEVPLDNANLLIDNSNNQFFVVIDSNALEENATYSANFTVSSANPYVEPGNGTSLVANFSVVPRNVTFDEVNVSPSEQATVSGTASVAAGTELDVQVESTGANPFLKRSTATVTEDGTWEATFDFSDVPAGANFTVSVDDPRANATGNVTGAQADGETAGNETAGETTAEETAEAENETTMAEETTVAEETTAEADTTTAEETTMEEETTAAETAAAAEGDAAVEDADTTAGDASSAPALGFGPLVGLVAVAIALVGGALLLRRRR